MRLDKHVVARIGALVALAGALTGALAAFTHNELRRESSRDGYGTPAACPPDSVTPINPPATPLLSESATARETRFSFIAYGDTRGPRDAVEPGPGHTQVVEAMLETIKQMQGGPDPVRFVINSGDAVSNGRLTAPWNNAYVPLINRLTAANVPFFPTVGNHDVTDATTNLDPRRRTGLCHFFAATAALIPAEGSPRRLDGYPTYAFAYGNSFFIALDSHFAGDSLQFAWVERQLASLDRTRYVNVVVYFHHPAFSSAEHGTLRVEPYVALLRARYFPLFEKYHVRLVINGHEHEFEHWIERYEDASGPHRLDEIVSGGGGAPPYPYKREPDVADFLNDGAARHVTLEHRAKPQVDSLANAYHFVLVHVNGNELRVEVIGADPAKPFLPYGTKEPILLADPPRR